jgi:hypothetical protein
LAPQKDLIFLSFLEISSNLSSVRVDFHFPACAVQFSFVLFLTLTLCLFIVKYTLEGCVLRL